MPQAWETLNATWVVAACFIALLISFGAHNKRTGWKKERGDGVVTELVMVWRRWNRSLAPMESARAGVQAEDVPATAADSPPLQAPGLLARRSSI